MKSLPRGHTNRTTLEGEVIVKVYQGPDARLRRDRERAALTAVRGSLPVPAPLPSGPDELRTALVPGTHAQDLIAAGRIGEVLVSCGRVLRRIHAVGPEGVFPGTEVAPGQVLVHGDFGPNNLLLDERTCAATAVLDWEWAHVGDGLEDLAWCEWIVRMYHADRVDALEGFFEGYGSRPAWADRHRMMIAKCRDLVGFWRRWQPDAELTRTRERQLAATEAWRE